MQDASPSFRQYLAHLAKIAGETEATLSGGTAIGMDDAIVRVQELLRSAARSPNKVMFIGNGGSAGIAAHMAIDFAKNGGIRSMTFNDASSLTCLGNDLGYENVFAKQVEMHAFPGDVLIAISSSGQSRNILRAVEAAKVRSCAVVTLSGFSPDNNLRREGAINLFVGSGVYGFVETAHQAILHAILDFGMGWSNDKADIQPDRPMAQ